MAGQPLAEAYVRIDLDTRSFDRAFAGTQAAFKSGAAAISQTAKSMQMAVVAAFGAMTAAALSMKKAVSVSRDFDRAMREVWTLMDVSEAEMRDLSKTVALLGVKYGETGTLALKAFYQIVSASFQGADAIKILDAAFKTAIAGASDVYTAVDLLAGILNAYQMRAQDVGKVSDILFRLIGRGMTTLEELGKFMGDVIAAAAPAGVSLEEIAAALAFLTRNSQKTNKAVTMLASLIAKFIKPTDKLKEVLGKLGYSTGLAAIEAEGFFSLLRKIADYAKEAGIGLGELFEDQLAVRTAMLLTGPAADQVLEDYELMKTASGATAEAYAKMADSVDLRMRQFSKSFEFLWRAIGDLFSETVAEAAGNLAKFITSLGKTIDQSEEFRDSLQYILKEGLKLGALIAVLGGIFLALKMLLTPTGALLAALTALYVFARWNVLNIGEFLEQLGQKVTGAISFILEFAGLEDFAEQIRSLGSSVERAVGLAVAGFAGSVLVRWLLKGLTKPSAFIGVLSLAGAIGFELAMRWKKVTANAEQLANLITDTLGTVLGALVGFKLGGPWGAIFGAAAGRILAEGIELTIPLVLKFFSKGETEKFFTEFNNQLVSLANQLYETAQQGADKVKEPLQGALAYLSQVLVSPEAQANWEATLETLRGYLENVKTIIASTLPPEDAAEVGRKFAENLIKAIQDPKLQELVQEIFGDWLSVSDNVESQAEATGIELGETIQEGLASVDLVPKLDVSAALSKAADLGKRMGAQLTDSLNDAFGDLQLSVGFTTPPWLLDLLTKQEGGFVPGKGSGDRVPALLEPGEFVWPKELVRKYPEVIVGLWKKFRLGGFVGYQAGGAVLAGGGANQISGLVQGISKFLDMLDRLVSGMYDFLKPLVKGEENLAKFEADFKALRGIIDGLRQAGENTEDVFNTLMQQTQNQAQAAIDQADKMAGAGQVAEDLAAKLEGITLPSAEAGKKLRQLALESGRSAEDLIAIHAKAQDLISVAKQLYEAQRFFGLSTEATVSALRDFLSALGLSEAEINDIITQIIGSGRDLVSALSSLVSQAEALTLAQAGRIMALREQALAVLKSGRVIDEEGKSREATIGELLAAASAVQAFSSWLDAGIATLERLITNGETELRPLYERFKQLKESMALGPTFEEQRRAQEQAAEEAKRRQEELARKAREAFEESFRAPVKKALETGDWMEAALAIREMAKQKDDLAAQAKALPAVQGKTMELSEVYDLLIGAQRELLTSIDKEIAVRQIAGENVDALEELKTQIEELFDPLGEWKKALREATGLMAEDPLKASQGLRELFLKAKELGAGGAEAASLVVKGTRDQIRAYEEQIEDMELFGLDTRSVRRELEEFKAGLRGLSPELARLADALEDLSSKLIDTLVGAAFDLVESLFSLEGAASEAYSALNVPAGFKGARYEWAAAKPGEPYRPIEEAGEGVLGFLERVVQTFLGWLEQQVKDFLKDLLAGFSWENFVRELDWEDFIGFLGWGDFLAWLDWGDWVKGLDWNRFVSVLDWRRWVNPLEWPSLLGDISGSLVAFINAGIETLFGWLESMLGPVLGPIVGALGEFLQDLVTTVGALLMLGTTLGLIEGVAAIVIGTLQGIGDLINAFLTPISEELGRSWEKLTPLIDATRQLFASLSPVFRALGEVVAIGIGLMTDLFAALAPLFFAVAKVVGALAEALAPAVRTIAKLFEAVLTPVVAVLAGGLKALAWVVDLLGDVVEGAINSLKWIFNIFIGALNMFIDAVNFLFGWVGVHLEHLPYLQRGGIVTRPTLAWLGEAGPEAVIPLTGFSYPRLGLAAAGASISIEVEGRLVGNGRELVGVIERVRARDEIVRGKR